MVVIMKWSFRTKGLSTNKAFYSFIMFDLFLFKLHYENSSKGVDDWVVFVDKSFKERLKNVRDVIAKWSFRASVNSTDPM